MQDCEILYSNFQVFNQCIFHLTFATCYPLAAQSILKIGFALAEVNSDP